MDIKCIDSSPQDRKRKKHPDLTNGNLYSVIGIEGSYYRILGDLGFPFLYHKSRFEVVDSEEENDWVHDEVTEVGFLRYPEGLMDDDVFRDFFKGRTRAIVTVRRHASRITGRKIDEIRDEKLIPKLRPEKRIRAEELPAYLERIREIGLDLLNTPSIDSPYCESLHPLGLGLLELADVYAFFCPDSGRDLTSLFDGENMRSPDLYTRLICVEKLLKASWHILFKKAHESGENTEYLPEYRFSGLFSKKMKPHIDEKVDGKWVQLTLFMLSMVLHHLLSITDCFPGKGISEEVRWFDIKNNVLDIVFQIKNGKKALGKCVRHPGEDNALIYIDS